MSEVKKMSPAKQRKAKFRVRLEKAFLTYNKMLLVTVDNVGSKQLQEVRASIRGKGELLMGKNTMVRRTINDLGEKRPDLLLLLPKVNGNLGFLFVNEDQVLKEVRDIVTSNVVPAAARPGAFGQCDVIIPAGVTSLDPGQTSFFQAMNIATKIVKGAIEIITPVILVKKGERVSSSAVALLSKLEIKPFAYGVLCTAVFDYGSVYDSAVLDLTEDDLKNKFFKGARHVAAIAMALHYPARAAVPHILINAFKHCAAVALEIDYQFKEMQRFKDFLDNPDAFKSAAPAAAEEKAPEPEPEPEEEEDEDMGFDLFG
jgi:large subunit ribosomal protein LP0